MKLSIKCRQRDEGTGRPCRPQFLSHQHPLDTKSGQSNFRMNAKQERSPLPNSPPPREQRMTSHSTHFFSRRSSDSRGLETQIPPQMPTSCSHAAYTGTSALLSFGSEG